MNPILRPSATLILSPNTTFLKTNTDITVVTKSTDYIFSGRSAEIVDAVRYRLDGFSKLSDIVNELGISLIELSETLAVLADEVLIDSTLALEAKSPEEFLKAYFAICDFWVQEIFVQPFWKSLLSGSASRSLVLGWGIEFYHRVIGANKHNATAIAYCDDSIIREWLNRHYIEEFDHAQLFLKGLVDCGLDRKQLLATPPLNSTYELINYLNELAMSNTIAYTGTYGVMHSPRGGQTRDRIDVQFNFLINNYPFASSLLNVFRNHLMTDIELGHEEIVLERIIAHYGMLTPEIVQKILAAAQGMVEHFIRFFAGIYDFYSTDDASLPESLN